MKKMILLSSSFSLFLISGCSTHTANRNNESAYLLTEQMGNSVIWMQNSGEYRALAYQAFNLATFAYDQSIIPKKQKKAVVVDLDETMIDNTNYAAWQTKNHKLFSSDTWTQWVKAKQAQAVPGAVEFAQHVTKNGGTVFYVSNRKMGAEYQPTIKNLQILGFPNVSEKTVLLKDKTSNKDSRFEQITSQGYTIVVQVGDNLGDFSGKSTYHKTNKERSEFVDQNKEKFGIKYILLPNPIYGSWEGGLSNDYFKVDLERRLDIRRKSIKSWEM